MSVNKEDIKSRVFSASKDEIKNDTYIRIADLKTVVPIIFETDGITMKLDFLRARMGHMPQ